MTNIESLSHTTKGTTMDEIEQFALMLQKRHGIVPVPYDPYSEAVQLIEARWKDHADDGQRFREDAYRDDWARDRGSYTNGAAMVLADMVLYFVGLATYDEVPAYDAYNAEMPA